MKEKETKPGFLKLTTLAIVGVLLLVFAAVLLLWHGNANSMQAIAQLIGPAIFVFDLLVSYVGGLA